MIESVRRTSRNVKHWQSGDMALRWTAAGMLEAEPQFRRIVGHADLAKLALAVERDLAPPAAQTKSPHDRGGPPLPLSPCTVTPPGPPPPSFSTANGTSSDQARLS